MELSQALSLPLQALFLVLWPLHALSRTLQTLSCEVLPAFLQNVYIFTAHIVQKKFIKGHESAFRGRENACKESRVPLKNLGDREYL